MSNMTTRYVTARVPSTFNSVSSYFAPRIPTRSLSTGPQLFAPRQASNREKTAKERAKKKRKKYTIYKMPNLKDIQQFSLCDAVQYIRAFEVGRPPSVPKYEVAIRLKTKKDGPVVRNQIRLPHAVKTDIRICVICPPDSKAAKAAKDAGAVLVGEEEVFEVIKKGKIDFDRCLATPDSLPKLAKEGLPRILGPRGLMPNAKLGTVTENVGASVRNMLGGSVYRERMGVVRMPVGQLGFTPEMLRDNVKAFVEQVRKETSALSVSADIVKEVFEVVLSSTNSPGFSLNGEFRKEETQASPRIAVA